MADVVGFAFLGFVGDASRKTRFPPCRRHHPQRHALHDDNSRHGSKSGLWPFKKSAFGGKKISSMCYSIYKALPILLISFQTREITIDE